MILIVSTQSVKAQLKLDERNFLTFGNTTPYHDGTKYFNFTILGNVYVKGPATGHFFQIDTNPAHTRLAGQENQVVFYNSGTSTFNSIQVANVYTYSDARAKTNIKTLSNSRSIISQLRPVSYNFINSNMLTLRSGVASTPEYGFLAQDIERVIPGAVITDAEGKKLVNYQTLIPLLVEAVQNLQVEVDALKRSK